MKRATFLIALCGALVGIAVAQESAPTPATSPDQAAPNTKAEPAAPSPTPLLNQEGPRESAGVVSGTAETANTVDAKPPVAPLSQPDTFDTRVHRIVDDFNQRHQKREVEMSAYTKAGDSDPTLNRLAAPRRVEIELKDEQDREQTSSALAKAYADEAQKIHRAQKSLEDLIAKRRQALDQLTKPATDVDRDDLEVAAANLARQPGTEAQVREIKRRLADAERDDKVLPGKRAQAQQEVAGSEDELGKMQALEQSLAKESKAYAADAASAHENRLALADRLEFLAVRAQAEDVLDQGGKAVAAVQHLAPSPEVLDTLQSPNPRATRDAKPDSETPVSNSGDKPPEKP